MDYLAYKHVFDLITRTLPPPSLLIYLKAPVPVLMDRIRRRARNIETGISEAYLTLLESFYDDWMTNFDLCPVLTLKTDGLNFVNKPHYLNIVVEHIQEKLSGKEVVIFNNEN